MVTERESMTLEVGEERTMSPSGRREAGAGPRGVGGCCNYNCHTKFAP